MTRQLHWRERAACRTADPTIFSPSTRPPDWQHGARQVAKRQCGSCPVLASCVLAAWRADPRPSGIIQGGIWWPAHEARGVDKKLVNLLADPS